MSVDEVALSRAFGMNIDQKTITGKTQEYVNEISNDITADVSPIKTVLEDKFKTILKRYIYKYIKFNNDYQMIIIYYIYL